MAINEEPGQLDSGFATMLSGKSLISTTKVDHADYGDEVVEMFFEFWKTVLCSLGQAQEMV